MLSHICKLVKDIILEVRSNMGDMRETWDVMLLPSDIKTKCIGHYNLQ